jgi:hypothetical protein
MRKIIANLIFSVPVFLIACVINKEIKIENFASECIQDFFVNPNFRNVKNDFTNSIRDTNFISYSISNNVLVATFFMEIECEKQITSDLIRKGDSLFLTTNVYYPKNNEFDTNCMCPYQMQFNLSGINLEDKYYVYFLKPKTMKVDN